jgi:hypothetical protein
MSENYLCCQHLVQSATFLLHVVPAWVVAPQRQDDDDDDEEEEEEEEDFGFPTPEELSSDSILLQLANMIKDNKRIQFLFIGYFNCLIMIVII